MCLADCGTDAHAHIVASATCGPRVSNGSLFHKARRERALARVVAAVANLAGKGAPLQRAVVVELARDLGHIGITKDEVMEGARVKSADGGGGGAPQ